MSWVKRSKARSLSICVVVCMGAVLVGCASSDSKKKLTEEDYSPRVVSLGQPVPEGGGAFKVGRPYTIKGIRYTPKHQPNYDEVGIASWYGADFHGRKTANGEVYNMHALTAAHKTLPLPTYVRVTNLQNDKSIVVRVNDRGPFSRGRIIDLSKKVADILEFRNDGVAKVRVQYVGRAPLDGQDEWLTTTVRDNGTNRRVAAVDQKLAANAFATDGQDRANRERYRVATSAYSGRRVPNLQPAPVARLSASASTTSDFVQIGAFSVRENADRLANSAARYGQVDVSTTSDTGLYIVRLRPSDPSFDVRAFVANAG